MPSIERMPVVFVSHGAPDALLKSADTLACWQNLGELIPKPAAILVISAHWEATDATVSLATQPATLHDFSGFSPELYQIQYPAPGAPVLAGQVAALLSAAGINTKSDPDRGLDHGAWVPLSVMYPDADVPVAQLSLVANDSPEAHSAIGRALAPLRDAGVLIIATGSITHNFSWLDWHASEQKAPDHRASTFADWIANHLSDQAALLDYRRAPYGAEAHPHDDHILPLFVAIGAAKGNTPTRYQPNFTYGSLSMDAYLWRGPVTG